VIGDLTRHLVIYEFGRYISKEEALETLKKVQKAGAVHAVFLKKIISNSPK